VTLCSKAMWSALQQAGVRLARQQGSDPAKWRKSTKSELIKFAPPAASSVKSAAPPQSNEAKAP